MRRAVGACLSGALLLGACTLPAGVTDPRRPTASRPPVTTAASASATPASAASATPTPTPTPGPTATPTPSVPMKVLSGSFKIDASYVIAAGGGSIIAAGGGNIIAAGGGNIIAAGGGNVIASGGGNIIAAGGGNVIAAGGGNVIAAGGGNILAGGTSLYRPQAAIEPGTILPVKGMVVVPISLLTGKPIGPAVTTDETGGFQVQVPEGTSQNVLIYGAMPGKGVEDLAVINNPRLRFGVVVNPQDAKAQVIDEETAIATRYTLLSLLSRLKAIIDSPDPDATIDKLLGNSMRGLPDLIRAALITEFKALSAAAKQHGYDGLSDADKLRMLHGATDALTAYADFGRAIIEEVDMPSNPIVRDRLKRVTEPMLKLYPRMFKSWSDAAAHKLLQPGAFDNAPYIKAANANRPAGSEYRILKPADFSDFLMREYMAKNAPDGISTEALIQDVLDDLTASTHMTVSEVQVVPGDATSAVRAEDVLRAGHLSILREVGKVMLNKEAVTAAQKAIAEFEP